MNSLQLTVISEEGQFIDKHIIFLYRPEFLWLLEVVFLSQPKIQPLDTLKGHKWLLCNKNVLGRFAPFIMYNRCYCEVNARNQHLPNQKRALSLATAAFCIDQSIFTALGWCLAAMIRPMAPLH